jgi:hypothetical protein
LSGNCQVAPFWWFDVQFPRNLGKRELALLFIFVETVQVISQLIHSGGPVAIVLVIPVKGQLSSFVLLWKTVK